MGRFQPLLSMPERKLLTMSASFLLVCKGNVMITSKLTSKALGSEAARRLLRRSAAHRCRCAARHRGRRQHARVRSADQGALVCNPRRGRVLGGRSAGRTAACAQRAPRRGVRQCQRVAQPRRADPRPDLPVVLITHPTDRHSGRTTDHHRSCNPRWPSGLQARRPSRQTPAPARA